MAEKEKIRAEEVVIDAENAVLGRTAAFAAKQALYGKKIAIVNCNNMIILGNPNSILEHYKHKIVRGSTEYGPYYPKTVEKLVKRVIRGMLPYKKKRGSEAFKRIKCYKGMPAEYANKKKMDFKKELRFSTNYVTIENLCKLL